MDSEADDVNELEQEEDVELVELNDDLDTDPVELEEGEYCIATSKIKFKQLIFRISVIYDKWWFSSNYQKFCGFSRAIYCFFG